MSMYAADTSWMKRSSSASFKKYVSHTVYFVTFDAEDDPAALNHMQNSLYIQSR